jgi:anti-sigma factor RsiW
MTAPAPEALLSAFVDGELPPHEAARVAEAIAASPALAQRAARLHQMKAALAGYGADLPLPDMPHLPPRSGRAISALRLGKLVALGSVAALCAVLILGVMPVSAPVSAPVAVLEPAAPALPALALHDDWLAAPPQAVTPDFPAEFGWMQAAARASGLQLVHQRADLGQTHLGFKGPNACRLSLLVSDTGGREQPLRLTLSDSVQYATWQRQGVTFEMVARDMATARFATVAAGLYQGSKDHGADGALHIALLQSARLPCRVGA